MKLVIDRKRWARGYSSSLLESNGEMCCLGFLAVACGYQDEDIMDHGLPHDTVGWLGQGGATDSKWPEWAVYAEEKIRDSAAVESLIEINDDTRTTDAHKESEIARIFGEHGVEIEFK